LHLQRELLEDEDWVGVKKASIDWFKVLLTEVREAHLDTLITSSLDFKMPVIDLPDDFRKLDFSNATRFNQGDRYFNKRAGLPLNATKPGESGKSHLAQLCEWVYEKD
jgi:hypothetical protein